MTSFAAPRLSTGTRRARFSAGSLLRAAGTPRRRTTGRAWGRVSLPSDATIVATSLPRSF